MSNTVYARLELVRTFRNRRFMLFSLAFPLALYLLVAGPNRHAHLGGIPFPLYYMVGMVAWGTMAAMLSSGARIATERAAGWSRQLRITPLPPSTYFAAKVGSAYALAAGTIVILFSAGIGFGVSLTATEWLEMTALLLVGLVPFAVLGVLMGHLLTPESVGPAIGGATAFLALLGGAYGPIATTGFLHDLVQLLPSYWLVQAGYVALGGRPWGAEGWIVVAAWSLVLTRLAVLAWRRDTQRV